MIFYDTAYGTGLELKNSHQALKELSTWFSFERLESSIMGGNW